MALLAMANNPWYVILQNGNSVKTQQQYVMLQRLLLALWR